MAAELRDTIARGLCSFTVGINRNRDGYGSLTPREPEKPCDQICDYCWHQADHLITYLEEWKNDYKQSD